MLEEILNTTTTATTATTISMETALLYAAVAGLLGFVISLGYYKTGRVSKNFIRTLVILPIMVCVVMTMVNGNLGTSVAIMGAFSLVRFRSLQGNSRDIGYIFFAMTIGLTCSMGYLLFALCITVLILAVQLLLTWLRYGESRQHWKDLRVTIPEHLDYSGIFDELFDKYTKEHKLIRVKTTNMGSLYELEYEVILKEEKQEKEFLDEIRCRNGNLTVICGRTDMGEEEL